MLRSGKFFYSQKILLLFCPRKLMRFILMPYVGILKSWLELIKSTWKRLPLWHKIRLIRGRGRLWCVRYYMNVSMTKEALSSISVAHSAIQRSKSMFSSPHWLYDLWIAWRQPYVIGWYDTCDERCIWPTEHWWDMLFPNEHSLMLIATTNTTHHLNKIYRQL